MDISQPHDSFFRFLMSNQALAADLIRNLLPPHLSQHYQLDTLTPIPDTSPNLTLKG